MGLAVPCRQIAFCLLLAALIAGCLSKSVLAQQQSSPQQQENSRKKSAQSPSAAEPLDFSDQVVSDVLEVFQSGIQSHNLKQALSVFDPESMPDYPRVRDDLRAFFDRYSVLLFRYKVLQLSSEGDRGFVITETDVDATPLDQNLMALRRSTQMRFELKQTPKGWKVVGIKPNDFFTQ